MSPADLHATTFTLFDQSPSRRPADVWEELAETLIKIAPERYASIGARRYRLRLSQTREASPQKRFVRYRTLDLHIRIKRGLPALLDLTVGNVIYPIGDESAPVATALVPESAWVRAATAIPLREHLQFIHAALLDFDDADWLIEPAPMGRLQLDPIVVESGQGQRPYTPAGVSKLVGCPLWMPENLHLAVFPLTSNQGERFGCQVADQLRSTWQRMFRGHPVRVSDASHPPQDWDGVALIVIPDRIDLGAQPDLRDRIRGWESAGLRFKLARASTTNKLYPLQNLAFDLSGLGGALHWQMSSNPVRAVAFDAGHESVGGRSRWACATMDDKLRPVSIRTIDTSLAEHLPLHVSDAFWPPPDIPVVLRDGRLARERDELDARAASEGRSLWEIKKHPGALLFRGDFEQPGPASFGDTLVDPHGEVLLQTLPHGTGDAIHPLRLASSQTAQAQDVQVSHILTQCAAPSLTMFQQSRLPGAIYWADLASKLDHSGWAKIVGRGYGLESVVP